MKNTKNLLITGVALVIALFASVQITAMAPGVNSNLTEQQKRTIERDFKFYGQRLDPNSPYFGTGEERELAQAMIKGCEEVYYGNRPYTPQEIEATVAKYTAPVYANWQ